MLECTPCLIMQQMFGVTTSRRPVCWCNAKSTGARGGVAHRADVDGAGRPAGRAGCGRCGLPLRCAAAALLREPSRCRLRAAGPRELRGAVRLTDDALLRAETIAEMVSFTE